VTDASTSALRTTTLFGRLLGTPGVAIYGALLVGAVVFVACSVWQALERSRIVDLGLSVRGDLTVEAVDHRWHDVQVGDRLISLDGVTLFAPREITEHMRARGSGPVTLELERDGRRWKMSAAAAPLRFVDEIALWVRLFTGAAMMVVGFLAFLIRPGGIRWVLLAFSWALAALVLSKIALWADSELYWRFAPCFMAASVSLGTHMVVSFPQKLELFERRPRLLVTVYLPAAFSVLVAIALAVSGSSPSPAARIANAWGAIAAVLGIGAIVMQYRQSSRSKDPRALPQYRALAVAFFAGLVLPALWNAARTVLDIWNSPWAAYYNTLPLLLFVAMATYAAVRHNALAIDRVTAAVVGYGLTVAVVGSAYGAVLLALSLVLGQKIFSDSPATLAIVTAIAAAGSSPLYRSIKLRVDRRFFRDQADTVRIAESLRKLLSAIQSDTLERALQTALESTDLLRAGLAELWRLDDEGNEFRAHVQRGAERKTSAVMRRGALGLALAGGASGGVQGLAARELRSEAQEEMWQHGFAVVAPITAHGVLAGFVALDRKLSGGAYTLEEVAYLSIVGAQIGMAIERHQDERRDLGRYRIQRRLGVGGMAEVFLAWQLGPGGFERKVAVKRPLPEIAQEPKAVAMFLDEARIAAGLNHKNIAQVYEVGESEGRYFIAMEYVGGPSLRALLRLAEAQHVQMPVEIAIAVADAVLDALDHAHNKSGTLVHRDIKPGNVLIGRDGLVKLVDFGIARAASQWHATVTGTVRGTLAYMPAEQALGIGVDERADLYAVAAMLYEMITSVRAFPAGPLLDRPKPVSVLAPKAPRLLDAVIERAMARDREQRYATATEMRAAIDEAIAPLERADPKRVWSWVSVIAQSAAESETHERGAPTVTVPTVHVVVPEAE